MEKQPLDQRKLEKIPKTTIAKNMRNVEDIMAEYIANNDSNLTPDEQRLLDRKVHEKTGKHIAKFKNKPAKLKFNGTVVSANGDTKGQLDAVPGKMRTKTDPVTVPGVSVNGAIS